MGFLSSQLQSKPVNAFEPISIAATLVGAVISPIVCKEIECTKDVTVHIDRIKNHYRLKEMRNSFNWDDDLINKNDPLRNGGILTTERKKDAVD